MGGRYARERVPLRYKLKRTDMLYEENNRKKCRLSKFFGLNPIIGTTLVTLKEVFLTSEKDVQ